MYAKGSQLDQISATRRKRMTLFQAMVLMCSTREMIGSAYDSFDGVTAGTERLITPLDGQWVKVFKTDISLRIPALGTTSAWTSSGVGCSTRLGAV